MNEAARLAPLPAREPVSVEYFAPSPDLARLVSSYYLFRSDPPLVEDVARAEHPQLRFLISGGGSYRFGNGQPVQSPRMALTGPTHAATRIAAHGPALAFGIGLLPAGWAALVGHDAHKFRDRVVDASELFGSAVRTIAGRLQAARTGRQMVALADALVRHLETEGQEPPYWFTEVVDAWLTGDVSPDVDTLVAATGLSARQVERLANRIYGAPPKLLARKFRALRAAARIAAGDDWRALHEGAFYDQSHAIREFKRFIGMTPGQLVHSRSPLAQITCVQRARLERLPALTRVT